MSNGGVQAGTQQAFALQYLTLMIIILAFLVGTFSARSAKNKLNLAEELKPAPVSATDEKLNSELVFKDLFIEGRLNEEKAAPLAVLLLNHDLDAVFSVNLNLCKEEASDSSCFARELEAAGAIRTYMQRKGVPAHSVTAYYAPLLEHQAVLNFTASHAEPL